MNLRTVYSKYFLRYPHILWLLGFLLPALYFLFLVNLKKVINQFKKRDSVITFLVLLLIIQILSIIPTFLYPYFSFGRLAGIIHNIVAFCFVFLGYAIMSDNYLRAYFVRHSLKVFYVIAFLILVGVVYSFITSEPSYFYSIPRLLGFRSKFTDAVFSFPVWHIVPDFPRTWVLSIYPNGTGLTLLMIHSIYMFYNHHRSNLINVLSFLVLILCIFATGSRSFLVLSIFLLIVYLIKTKSRLWSLTLMIPVVILIATPFITYLLSIRYQSNDMRSLIYINSFNYMMDINPVLGLGLKPIIPEIADRFPLGSHSTPLGYMIKCGIVGGLFVLLVYFKIFIQYGIYLFKLVFSDMKLDARKLYNFSSFVVILIASFFEDLDAFELLPLFFGMMLWNFFRYKPEVQESHV